MPPVLNHALSLTPVMAQTLATAEAYVLKDLGLPGYLRGVWGDVWKSLVQDVEAGTADLSVDYLADLHGRLARPAAGAGAGEFRDKGEPTTWTVFAGELAELWDVEGEQQEAYILSQLYWGKHVQSFAFTLGWMCLNSVRLKTGQFALYPPTDNLERLFAVLKFAGPDGWDCENLRAWFGDVERAQCPGWAVIGVA